MIRVAMKEVVLEVDRPALRKGKKAATQPSDRAVSKGSIFTFDALCGLCGISGRTNQARPNSNIPIEEGE